MVMKVDVVASALDAVRDSQSHVVLTSPIGTPLSQTMARRFAGLPHLVVVCGHYEGIDARIETLVDEVVSLGDFVLTGGELAACAIVDASARLIPGVLGNASSAVDESFTDGLLEYPHYTRPRIWREQEVPKVLLSGHHARIEGWRRERAQERTRALRPDLWSAWLAAGGVPDIDDGHSGP
jgi:tRNA (guanine37-N1)-methyltransferase